MSRIRKELRDDLQKRHPELSCFPQAVKRVVLRKGLHMMDVVKASGMSRASFYYNLESQNMPNLDVFYAISDGLKITPEELLAEMRGCAVQKEKKALDVFSELVISEPNTREVG